MQTILARWTRRKEKLRPVDHASNVWRSSAVRVIGSAKFIHKYYDIVGPEVKLKVNLFMTHYTSSSGRAKDIQCQCGVE